MFFKRKIKKDDWVVGMIPKASSIMMAVRSEEAERFRKIVDAEVERRLALKKAEDEFQAAPTYKITSTYDVRKNEDTYHLQRKSFYNSGYGTTPTTNYETIYSSTDKLEVDARFKRLSPFVKS